MPLCCSTLPHEIIIVGIRRNCQERLGHHKKGRLIQLSLCFPTVITSVINLCRLTVLHFEKGKWKKGQFQTNLHHSLKSEKRVNQMSNLAPLHVLKQPRSSAGSSAATWKGRAGELLPEIPGYKGFIPLVGILQAAPKCSEAQLTRPWRRAKEISAVQRPFVLLVMSIAHNAARAFVNDIIIQSVNKSVSAISCNSFSPHFIVSN